MFLDDQLTNEIDIIRKYWIPMDLILSISRIILLDLAISSNGGDPSGYNISQAL